MPQENMQAAVHRRYGPPGVVRIGVVPVPAPAPNEIQIKVKFSTVNRTDAGFRSARYFVSRFWSGQFRPKYTILGCEFYGRVSAIGSEVTQFRVGDEVFGYNDHRFGGHAEYVCINACGAVTTVPKLADTSVAAAITEGAHYALSNIRAAGVRPGQKALVYGASGSIGSAAVQLLKFFGAEVTAVSGKHTLAQVGRLGADRIINYQEADFTKGNGSFDFIFDAVGKTSYKICRPLLTPKGIFISTEPGKGGVNFLHAIYTSFSKGKRVLFPLPSISRADIEFLKARVEDGSFLPLIDRCYPLSSITEAYRYVETGQKIGNVLLKIGA